MDVKTLWPLIELKETSFLNQLPIPNLFLLQ